MICAHCGCETGEVHVWTGALDGANARNPDSGRSQRAVAVMDCGCIVSGRKLAASASGIALIVQLRRRAEIIAVCVPADDEQQYTYVAHEWNAPQAKRICVRSDGTYTVERVE